MTRVLAVIVIIELLVGAWLVGARLRRPAPPQPDLAMVDGIAADQLRERARHVKTAGDWRDLGEANMAVGYFPEAEACHRIAFDRDRGNANLAFEYAFALERLGRLDDAIREYRRAIDLGHERPADCHFLAGRCQMRGENEAAALAEFEAAGDLPTARYERARIWARRGQPATALQLLEPLLHEFPDTIQPATLRYQIAQHQRDRLAMFTYADRAERAKRRLPGPFDRESSRLMDAHARLGQHGRWQLASKLIPAGKYADAEAQLRAALAVGWHPIGADLLAEVALDLGRVDEAVRLLEEVVARDGPTAQGLRRLGDALAEAGRAEEARAVWLRSAFVGAIVESKDTHHRLAASFGRAGDQTARQKHWARANMGAGVEQLRAGAFDDARRLFEESTKADPKLAPAWFYLGEAHRVDGRRNDAIAAFKAALAADPNHGRTVTTLEFLELDRR